MTQVSNNFIYEDNSIHDRQEYNQQHDVQL